MFSKVKSGFNEYLPGEWYFGVAGVEILLNASYVVQGNPEGPGKHIVKDSGSGQSVEMTNVQLKKAAKLGFDLCGRPEYTPSASKINMVNPEVSFKVLLSGWSLV